MFQIISGLFGVLLALVLLVCGGPVSLILIWFYVKVINLFLGKYDKRGRRRGRR